MSLLLRIAWRNIWRQKRRTWITVGALAFGISLTMATIAFMDGMFAQGFDLMVRQNLGHIQVHNPKFPKQHALYDTIKSSVQVLEQIASVDGVKAASGRVLGYALLAAKDKAAGAQLVGMVPEQEAQVSGINSKILAGGRYLSASAQSEIVLGVELADTLAVSVGSEVVAVTQAADGSMGNELYKVVGIIKTGSLIKDRAGAYLHRDDVQALLAIDNEIHEIAILASREERIDALALAIKSKLQGRDLLVRTWDQINPMMAQMLGMQEAMVGVILLIVFSVAVLGVLNTMLMSVFERTKELGVIRALGLRPQQMVMLVVFESCALALVATTIGVLIGLVFDAYLMKYGLDLSSYMENFSWAGVNFSPVIYAVIRPQSIIITIVGLFFITILASLWPAMRAARLQPVEAMRQE